MTTKEVPGLNDRALLLADEMQRCSAELAIKRGSVIGARVLDVGIESRGSLRAGLLLSQIAMANLGTVSLVPNPDPMQMTPAVAVNISHPLAACIICQHDGWLIQEEETNFKARGSGPFRAAYGREELYEIFGFRERTGGAVGIIETQTIPSRTLVNELSIKCGIQQHHLGIICVNPDSLAGSVLTASRTVEWALMKLHMLNFNIKRIVGGYGICPLGLIGGGLNRSVGQAYDQLIYNSSVTLYSVGDDDTLASVVTQLPSSTSALYGQRAQSLLSLDQDPTHQLDAALMAPAKVCIQNIETGICHCSSE
jgi:methenyltetrahydromethanopterin cyclohydrolase